MAEPILRVRGLSKNFHVCERGRHIQALDGVDFDVHAGTLTLVSGPSGSGKSSVLSCIHRTYLPSHGSLHYLTGAGNQVDLAQLGEYAMLLLRRNEIAFVTQFLRCLPRKSALEVVARPLLALGASRADALARAAEALAELGLAERLWELPPSTFSGGEKQRVNIARGCIARPRLLLLDEPTASLDAEAARKVVGSIARALSRGAGVLAVFHDSAPLADLKHETVRLRAPQQVF
jgi:alpha-D-ribose 1-methylphosphonate 5-triphosphate synthase subunit PhnL